jgi:hypothetical protein
MPKSADEAVRSSVLRAEWRLASSGVLTSNSEQLGKGRIKRGWFGVLLLAFAFFSGLPSKAESIPLGTYGDWEVTRETDGTAERSMCLMLSWNRPVTMAITGQGSFWTIVLTSRDWQFPRRTGALWLISETAALKLKGMTYENDDIGGVMDEDVVRVLSDFAERTRVSTLLIKDRKNRLGEVPARQMHREMEVLRTCAASR